MKNMTIVLSEDVAQWARVWAAKHDTSVSRMLGDMLHERMEQDAAYGASMASFLARQPAVLKESGTRYPARAEIHER